MSRHSKRMGNEKRRRKTKRTVVLAVTIFQAGATASGMGPPEIMARRFRDNTTDACLAFCSEPNMSKGSVHALVVGKARHISLSEMKYAIAHESRTQMVKVCYNIGPRTPGAR